MLQLLLLSCCRSHNKILRTHARFPRFLSSVLSSGDARHRCVYTYKMIILHMIIILLSVLRITFIVVGPAYTTTALSVETENPSSAPLSDNRNIINAKPGRLSRVIGSCPSLSPLSTRRDVVVVAVVSVYDVIIIY